MRDDNDDVIADLIKQKYTMTRTGLLTRRQKESLWGRRKNHSLMKPNAGEKYESIVNQEREEKEIKTTRFVAKVAPHAVKKQYCVVTQQWRSGCCCSCQSDIFFTWSEMRCRKNESLSHRMKMLFSSRDANDSLVGPSRALWLSIMARFSFPDTKV